MHKVLVTVDALERRRLSKRCPFALSISCRMLLLTRCAGCAADLTNVVPRSAAKECGRCETPYCGRACQEQHWKEGGHDKLCKKIKKAGGCEQYHADTKYKEAVAVAVEECADDTKGQKCYICLLAVHPTTGEGLVRGCACGDRDGVSSPELGVVHVSCLARQAKELVEEDEENNLDPKVIDARWRQWDTCTLCGKQHHGVVRCALGWACWKTYVGRPMGDEVVHLAMGALGNGLYEAGHDEDALSVREADVSLKFRLGVSEERILATQSNIAQTYMQLGKLNDACRLMRYVYSGYLKAHGEEDRRTLLAASNYAASLTVVERLAEANSVIRKVMPVAQRVLGNNDEVTLKMRMNHANWLVEDPNATLKNVNEAIDTLEEIEPTVRRVFGIAHPFMADVERSLEYSRATLRASAIASLEESGLTLAEIEKLELEES